jgi:hypothetical protein
MAVMLVVCAAIAVVGVLLSAVFLPGRPARDAPVEGPADDAAQSQQELLL